MLTTNSRFMIWLASILGVCRPRLARQARTVASRPTAVPAIVTIGEKSVLLERAPSDVKKDDAKDVKVTPDQRPNRAARDRRARNLTRTTEESKAKREVVGSNRSFAFISLAGRSSPTNPAPGPAAFHLLDTHLSHTRPNQ